jgi:hypothetical protein
MFSTYKLNYNLNISSDIDINWLFSEYYIYIDSKLLFLKTKDLYTVEYNSVNFFFK